MVSSSLCSINDPASESDAGSNGGGILNNSSPDDSEEYVGNFSIIFCMASSEDKSAQESSGEVGYGYSYESDSSYSSSS